jgi:hypothetical protein
MLPSRHSLQYSVQLGSTSGDYCHRRCDQPPVVNHSHRSTVSDAGQRLQSPVISHSHRSFATVCVVGQSHRSSATITVHQLQSLFISYSHRSSPAVGPPSISCPATPAVSHLIMGLPETTAVQQLQPSSLVWPLSTQPFLFMVSRRSLFLSLFLAAPPLTTYYCDVLTFCDVVLRFVAVPFLHLFIASFF